MSFYIILSLIMFFCGVYGFITRKNLIAMLMSLELILNAVNINFTTENCLAGCGFGAGLFWVSGCLCVCGARSYTDKSYAALFAISTIPFC